MDGLATATDIYPRLDLGKVRHRAAFAGTGHYLPAQELHNTFFERSLGLSDEWIVTRTGIRSRRMASENESASDMGTRAAVNALSNACIQADEIDVIICTTISPDMPLPSTACLIQASIGAKRAVAFDVSAACAGFLYGLEIAEKMIGSGSYKNALIVSVDIMTRWVNYKDPQTCALFGDGAGAVVLTRCDDDTGVLGTKIYSNGDLSNLAFIPASSRGSDQLGQKLKMDGKRTFKQAVQCMTNSCVELLDDLGLESGDIQKVIPHQANQRIIDAVTIALEIDADKVFSNIQFVGNTAAGSVPIALDQCRSAGMVHKGDKVLLTAFGGGAVWGASVIQL